MYIFYWSIVVHQHCTMIAVFFFNHEYNCTTYHFVNFVQSSPSNVKDAGILIYYTDDSQNMFATRNFTHLHNHLHYPSAAKNKQKKKKNHRTMKKTFIASLTGTKPPFASAMQQLGKNNPKKNSKTTIVRAPISFRK